MGASVLSAVPFAIVEQARDSAGCVVETTVTYRAVGHE